jgi:molecular chaperone Hsp33
MNQSFATGNGGPQRPAARDDLIQPFKIEGQAVRGRLVRLGPLIDTVLDRHQYPPIVAELLGETVALAAALAGALKYDGVFTLQTKGNGPIRLMVADVTSDGDVRGYAQFDAESLAAVVGEGDGASLSVPRLLGAGYLAFTVDQGSHTERYQGIVELTGATLADCVHHYFRQRLPPSAGAADEVEDGWRRTLAFMASSTPEELLDARLAPNDLLYRLFHEDGVRVFATAGLRPGCRCSRERVERVLRSLPEDELETFKVDGRISVTCEFCSASYDFTDGEIAALRQSDIA